MSPVAPSHADPPTVDPPLGFWRRCFHLLGPFAVTGAAWFVLYLLRGEAFAYDALRAGAASVVGFGTTVVFGKAVLGEHLLLTTWDLAALVMWLNAATGWFFAYNLDLGQRLPVIGPYLARARRNAVRTLKERPWIRRLSTIGVSLFVLTPLPGSGSLGGCVMARIVGMSKRASFLAVTFAGVAVCVAYAYGAHRIEPLVVHAELWMKVAGAAVLLLIVWLLVRLLKRLAGVQEEVAAEHAGTAGSLWEAIDAARERP
jgi:uncharacterized membrane protein